jgi:hypothetical protein
MIKGDHSAIILAMRELLLGPVTPNWPLTYSLHFRGSIPLLLSESQEF